MNSFWNSIRWRIFCYYTLLTGVAIILLAGAFYFTEKANRERLEVTRLQATGVKLLPMIFPPAGMPSARISEPPVAQGSARMPLERRWAETRDLMDRDRIFYLAFSSSDQLLQKSAGAPASLEDPGFSRDKRQMERLEHPDYMVAVIIAPRGKRIVVGRSREVIDAEIGHYLRNILVLAMTVFVITTAFGYIIITRGLRPIESISATAQKIADGDLGGRIQIREQSSELGGLGSVLNQTFDRLEQLLKQQVQFTADASHDLRTPIAAILADCQFSLKKPRTTERYLETIEVCHESAQHMRMLVDQLGLLARFDADTSELTSETVELSEEIKTICHVLQPVADDMGIYLGSDLSEAHCKGDRLRLRQVWFNLLNNALCYTEQGGHVKVRTGRENGTVWLEVADNGIGIPPEVQPHVFDRFYRVDESRSVKTGGTGLGLAICKTIVEAHGGNISVQSEVGKGSCFRVELPHQADL
ncbi:MAG: HAMP domain-containing sensor histidine kinase [Verrucomicrobiota bacterium]